VTAVSERPRVDRRGDDRAPRPGPSLLAAVLIPVVLAVPLFAHGCHTGDHDDEPVFAPPVRNAEAPR
jgi:hypothetical protein